MLDSRYKVADLSSETLLRTLLAVTEIFGNNDGQQDKQSASATASSSPPKPLLVPSQIQKFFDAVNKPLRSRRRLSADAAALHSARGAAQRRHRHTK